MVFGGRRYVDVKRTFTPRIEGSGARPQRGLGGEPLVARRRRRWIFWGVSNLFRGVQANFLANLARPSAAFSCQFRGAFGRIFLPISSGLRPHFPANFARPSDAFSRQYRAAFGRIFRTISGGIRPHESMKPPNFGRPPPASSGQIPSPLQLNLHCR